MAVYISEANKSYIYDYLNECRGFGLTYDPAMRFINVLEPRKYPTYVLPFHNLMWNVNDGKGTKYDKHYAYVYAHLGDGEYVPTSYMTFSTTGSGSFSINNYGGNEVNLIYSTDGESWSPYTSAVSFTGNLYVCGDNPDGFSKSDTSYTTVSVTGGDINCSGDVMSLISSFYAETEIPSDFCFSYLFCENTNLKTAPVLGAEKLTAGCYYGMFRGCTSLASVPTLKAQNLSGSCFMDMFRGCSSLVTVPLDYLPITTLAMGCYAGMFYECEKLTQAPNLPATTLTYGCYKAMFDSCESLVTAPALPATTLAEQCYMQMFEVCIKLKNAPAISAAELPTDSCNEMFYGCVELETPPIIKSTILSSRSCKGMFAYCYKLASTPTMTITKMNGLLCCEQMFGYCIELKNAPITFNMTELVTQGCYGMFYNDVKLETVPVFNVSKVGLQGCSQMFAGCTSLETAPELPATSVDIYSYSLMFYGCTGLKYAPSILPAETLSPYCYYRMFTGCSNLITSPTLPATELARACYAQMFHSCKSLSSIQYLPAKELQIQCYYQMYYTCQQIYEIHCDAEDITAEQCTTRWVHGIGSTSTSPKNFYGKTAAGWTTGVSGIPSGWTQHLV